MIRHLLHIYAQNLDYAKRLTKDLPAEKWAFQPAPKTNHAAWVIGHLAASADLTLTFVGQPSTAPKDWEKLFGWNSSPSPDAKLYPAGATLIKALEDYHAQVAAAVQKVPAADFAKPFPIEAWRSFAPTIGDAFFIMLGSHENIHLGQLSAWRRVQGLPSV